MRELLKHEVVGWLGELRWRVPSWRSIRVFRQRDKAANEVSQVLPDFC